ncbi:porphobilinogen synthase [Syntrophotalea carbinolica DSM 2380]|uniref:Delta-aminolevulinic acid dehydratase n=1 Tax=Syntrophotalea carbinolica (strain DSM 2380 / NBRC 103641 / GraBd1) TaxID=338963 RepID=Q3A011_SYNC1|nr:porphobilinogen synthase [Syntrophotalea carbinolica]ABA90296.1 porphobilinogen synthase [Syntrophotalea carbinolica DSM 2380]
MKFPEYRARRTRRTPILRNMVRETQLAVDDFIYPLFCVEGTDVCNPISSMPGVSQMSVDRLAAEAREIRDLGIPAVILFGIPDHKDAEGSEGTNEDGIIPRSIRAIKAAVPELIVVTDVCMCEYTDHGHCGLIRDEEVVNDPTLRLLSLQALAHARAGADIIAPSDMMDGRVAAIRRTLDSEGFDHLPIMSYAVKYASAFYGPFREAAESAPQFGDRRSYQMDPANRREALREAQLDVNENADFLIVKPAMAYLDILRDLRERFDLPLVAYNVSGEFAMLKAAAQQGWVDHDKVMLELLTGMKRAGADLIITYHAKEAAKLLNHA